MAEVAVVMTFTPNTLEIGGPTVTVGRTCAPAILRAVRDAILGEAMVEAAYWREVDPVLGMLREADRFSGVG